MFARGHTLPLRHTPWGQRSTSAIGLALTAAWASTVWHFSTSLLLVLYAVALLTMTLALLGILRRTPGVAPHR
jgi:hypothetical protein